MFATGVIVIAVTAGCTSDQPDPGPPDPETLAASGLTTDDFTDGSWEALEVSMDMMFPTPVPDATPFPLPPELESCLFLQEGLEASPTPPPSLSSAHGRAFYQPRLIGGGTTIFTRTSVFSTRDAAREASDANDNVDVFSALEEGNNDECRRALAASRAGVHDGSAIIVRRARDPGFEIRGVTISQFKTTISSSAGVESNVTTVASFVRGYVVATYNVTETDDDEIDHEGLLRTFVQRVTDAQLED